MTPLSSRCLVSLVTTNFGCNSPGCGKVLFSWYYWNWHLLFGTLVGYMGERRVSAYAFEGWCGNCRAWFLCGEMQEKQGDGANVGTCKMQSTTSARNQYPTYQAQPSKPRRRESGRREALEANLGACRRNARIAGLLVARARQAIGFDSPAKTADNCFLAGFFTGTHALADQLATCPQDYQVHGLSHSGGKHKSEGVGVSNRCMRTPSSP